MKNGASTGEILQPKLHCEDSRLRTKVSFRKLTLRFRRHLRSPFRDGSYFIPRLRIRTICHGEAVDSIQLIESLATAMLTTTKAGIPVWRLIKARILKIEAGTVFKYCTMGSIILVLSPVENWRRDSNATQRKTWRDRQDRLQKNHVENSIVNS